MTSDYGCFPFGRRNTIRPMRSAASGTALATVVGVYPSAWHITWTAPPDHVKDDANGKVSAMAVDVEPTVFWNGDGSDFAARRERWMTAVGFEEGAHGYVSPQSPTPNGSSGAKVEHRYLAPICVDADRAAFTDICPVFFVKRGAGKRREQGDAIAREYDTIAAELGYPPSSLPTRPAPSTLVQMAVQDFKARIICDLEAADAPLVITLGDEVLQALRRIPELDPNPPAETLTDLYPSRYGQEGTLRVNGRTVRWLPLVHPGLLRGEHARDTPVPESPRTWQGWNILHAGWEAETGCGSTTSARSPDSPRGRR